MADRRRERLAVTGMGCLTSAGCGKDAFAASLRDGRTGIRLLSPEEQSALGVAYAGLLDREEVGRLLRARAAAAGPGFRKVMRRAGLSAAASCLAALEAVEESGIREAVAPERVGIFAGGSNLQGSAARPGEPIVPEWKSSASLWGLQMWDSHVIGCLSELIGSKGPAWMVGGASASGNLAVIQACQALLAGECDACVAVGCLQEFTAAEISALGSLGVVAGPDGAGGPPAFPFSAAHAGLVPGQGAAALVLERLESAQARGAGIRAEVLGWGVRLDACHEAAPSSAGEAAAMRAALHRAGLRPDEIDYVNSHGTGSRAGDLAEAEALLDVFGRSGVPRVNATKGFTGHCLSASGAIEAVATCLQIEGGFCHPNLGAGNPGVDGLRLVGEASEPARIGRALSNAFAFGGINTCLAFGGHG